MFCPKSYEKAARKCNCGSKCGAVIVGMLSGAVLTAIAFVAKDMKKKKCSVKKAAKERCGSNESFGDENQCDCDGSHDDAERARNDCYRHDEECNTSLLHSSGCLGYPHDDYEGFACSKGDRPNDLSNPELDNQKANPKSNSSPYMAKNIPGKGDPQPKNRIKDEAEKK